MSEPVTREWLLADTAKIERLITNLGDYASVTNAARAAMMQLEVNRLALASFDQAERVAALEKHLRAIIANSDNPLGIVNGVHYRVTLDGELYTAIEAAREFLTKASVSDGE